MTARAWGQSAVRALAKPHPAVAAEGGSVLHGLGGDDIRQTARDAVGWSLCKNGMLKRTGVEVYKGGNFPKPPKDCGGVCISQIVMAAPDRTMCAHALRVMNDWGGPVSKRATRSNFAITRLLQILILVESEEWSIETMPGTRHGPCSAREGTRELMFPALVSSRRRRRRDPATH